MAYGLVALAELGTTDMVPPGLPAFATIEQFDNQTIHCLMTLPTLDADGSNLTDMVKLTLATASKIDSTNPFEGLSMSQILALSGVISVDALISAADAGGHKPVDLPVVSVGGTQVFAAACAD